MCYSFDMKVIVSGHEYEVLNADGTRVIGVLQFLQKKKGKLVKDGTTTEQVIKILIDRIEFLQEKVPCDENTAAITALQTALTALEERTADRIERGVEGKDEE